MRRLFMVAGCAATAVLLSAGPAVADGGRSGGGVSYTAYNNLIQVDNSNPSTPAVSTGSAVSFDAGDSAVQNANLAYSHSVNCTGCRTVTVAVQVVVIEGNPTTIAPQNAGVAVNESCNSCLTYAYAHQYLLSPHHQVRLDGEITGRLAKIQSAINWVANSGEDFPTMDSQLNQLSWSFCDTVQRAVQSQQEGENAGSTQNVCGASPYNRLQVKHD